MSKDVFIFEVSKKSFEQSVILNSHKIPVIVEFMGVWSEPSIVIADIFSSLAKEFAEEFIFAKVDIDEQAELRAEYKIENIPTIIIFKDGKPVRTEVGQLQEAEARQLLKDYGVYNESDSIREQAREKHLAGDTTSAILLLTEAIQADPGNTSIAMDMVQIFIDIGELEQAKSLFGKLPESSHLTDMGKALGGQLAFIDLAAQTAGIDVINQALLLNPDDHDSRFDLAICQIAQYQYEDAVNDLFYILENNPDYKGGAAKEMIILVTNMIASENSDLAQELRRKLANILSS